MANIIKLHDEHSRGPLYPSWEPLLRLVLDGLQSPNSRRCYAKALNDFFAWHTSTNAGPFSKATVQAYRTHLQDLGLAPTTRNQHLSAIRKLAREASDNGLLDPQIASGIARVRGSRQAGTRIGNWLSIADAERLIQAPDLNCGKGRRDRAALALMIGCGLRRSEIVSLDVEHIQCRDGRWVILDLVGKGGRVRTVPIPSWVKVFIDEWIQPANLTSGRIFRAMDKADRITGATISSQGIYEAVKTHGYRDGLNIAPHDLRRTFAKLARAGEAPIEQIQAAPGHASILTTERYLGTKQDLKNGPGDRIRICFNRTPEQVQQVPDALPPEPGPVAERRKLFSWGNRAFLKNQKAAGQRQQLVRRRYMARRTRFEKICLLVEKDGRKVWKTFEGQCLVGIVNPDGSVVLSMLSEYHKRWGFTAWSVVESAQGKLVIYKYSYDKKCGDIEVYESFSAMQGCIPDDILRDAEIKAGIRKAIEFPEEPLYL